MAQIGAFIGQLVQAFSRQQSSAAASVASAKGSAAQYAQGRAKRNPTAANKAASERAFLAAHHADIHAHHAARIADRNDFFVNQMQAATDGLASLGSQFFHSITVTVKGGPRSSLRRCWFLCVAALFGRRRRGTDSLWAEAMDAQWDITGKSVTATLSYTTGAFTEPHTNFVDAESPFALLQRGPDQVTIGAGWPVSYMTLPQTFTFQGGMNKSLQNARIVGGQLTKDPTTSLAPVPGEIRDFAKVAQMGGPANMLNMFANQLFNVSINTNGQTGWVVRKTDTDELQPRPTPIVQPFTVSQTDDALSEMPIRIPGIGVESLPYRAHRPASEGDGMEFVLRGGDIGAIPVLPDDGRVITTGEKMDRRVQSPRPPVDGLSRGHLLDMVAAALASPGVLVEAPPNPKWNTSNLAAEGLFLRPPGTVFFTPLSTDRYRFQPAAVVAQIRQLGTAIVSTAFDLYTIPTVTNVRPPTN